MKMVDYLRNVLQDASHPKEDYEELLHLCRLLFLRGWSESDFKFRAPGAIYQARWMAKAIYHHYHHRFNVRFRPERRHRVFSAHALVGRFPGTPPLC